MNFEMKIEKRIEDIVSNWNDENIYAISFLLTTNGLSNCYGLKNFPEFSIGYNTESDCEGAPLLSEERWNFACWPQNNVTIIDSCHSDIAEELLAWYKEQGISNVGIELEDEMYDEDMNYIGKGPNGYWELINLISNIARSIQTNGDIKKRFGNIPIIVHDLEYSWYTFDMTVNANPNDEAKVFLDYFAKAYRKVEDDSIS